MRLIIVLVFLLSPANINIIFYIGTAMKSKYVAFGFLLSVFPLVLCAQKSRLPDLLTYDDNPIDPLCIFEAAQKNGTANLGQCGLNAEEGRKKTDENPVLKDRGFIGYDYSWKMNGFSAHGYSYYKPYGKLGDAAIVLSLNNSGGTGQFSSLNVITRDNDQIHVESYNGGDRCNQGIIDMKRVKGKLRYTINLTSYDLLSLAYGHPDHLNAVDGLSLCAVCCIATAVLERPVSPAFGHEKLLYIDLSAYAESIGQASAPTKEQACFESLLQQYKTKSDKLYPAEFDDFFNQYMRQCHRTP